MKVQSLPNSLPSKLCFAGDNYHATRSMQAKELILRIEIDLNDLAEKNPELGVLLKIHCNTSKFSRHGEILVKVIGEDNRVLKAIKDNVENILSSYNKQILLKKDGYFERYYLRFSYRLEFLSKRLFLIDNNLK